MATMPKSRNDLRSALPDVSSTLKFDAIDGTIEIYRDGFGIPHVRAQSEHDAFFGQGFATAQDRMWHMDVDRRRAYGRWAEFVGKSGIEQDVMMRKFQIGATVKADYEAVNADTKAMLDAYAAGVNAFIETTRRLPVEYQLVDAKPEPWQPWDSIAVFKVRHILMGVFEGKLWRAKVVNALGPEKAASLLRGYQPGHMVIVPPGAVYDSPAMDALEDFNNGLDAIEWLKETPESGSNNWAVLGSRTASGKPLVAGDPHRGLDTPNVYYQNHIACPDFDVTGLSFPGIPGFPHFGHNSTVAWCVTHAQADYQDIYVEKFNPDNPSQYEYKGQWKQAKISHEVIKVRDGEAVELDVTATHHGPVIGGDPAKGKGLAFRYTATAEPNRGFESILQMMKATNADEMDEAMREWVDPCNNFVFADVEGNVEYLNRGKLPIRPMANAWLPVAGWTGENEWQGYVPFEELARIRNPENGFIVTANNRIVGKDYPYYISIDAAPEYRARRIHDRLTPLNKATVEDMGSIHAEKISIPAQIYQKVIAGIDPLDDLSTKARQILVDWNCSMERDAVAPTIFCEFYGRLTRAVIGHLIGDALADEMFGASGRGAPTHMRHLATRMEVGAQENDISILPPGETWTLIAAKALSESVAELKARLGGDVSKWVWGDVHYTRPKHTLSDAFPDMAELLDPPSVPMGGGLDTPQAGGFSFANPFVITGMSVARYVFDTDNWDNSRWIVPLGSSGHPGSPHYADQASTWKEVDLIRMTYSWDRIRRETKSQQTLERD